MAGNFVFMEGKRQGSEVLVDDLNHQVYNSEG